MAAQKEVKKETPKEVSQSRLLVVLAVILIALGGVLFAIGRQDNTPTLTTEKTAKSEQKPKKAPSGEVAGSTTNTPAEDTDTGTSQNTTPRATAQVASATTASSNNQTASQTQNQAQQPQQADQQTGQNTGTTPPSNIETGTNTGDTEGDEETTPPEEDGTFDPLTDILEVPVGGNSASVTLASEDGSDLYWMPGTEAFSFSDDVAPLEKPFAPEYLVFEYPESEGPVHVGPSVTFHIHATENSVASDDVQETLIAVADEQDSEPELVDIAYTVVNPADVDTSGVEAE